MSDAAAAGNGQAQGDIGGDAQQGAFDASGMSQQLQALTSGQEEMRQQMQQFLSQSQEPPEAQTDPALDLSYYEQFADPSTGLPGESEQVPPHLQQMQQIHQQAMQELEQARSERMEARIERDAQALADEFPEFRDPEVHTKVFQTAREKAEEYEKRTGITGFAERMMAEPSYWRDVYMQGKAADAANSEGRDAPNAAHLEGGGGATPAGSQVNWADMIVNAGGRKGSSVLDPS